MKKSVKLHSDEILHWKDADASTVLHLIVSGADTEALKLLLKEYPQLLNETNRAGETILHLSCMLGNFEMS